MGKTAKKVGDLKRGCFARYSHDKIFIVSRDGKALKALTGSTNFSVTGLYVNANHVLVFDDPGVARFYAETFQESWAVLTKRTPSKPIAAAFASTSRATKGFTQKQNQNLPKLTIHVSPHTSQDTDAILTSIQKRISAEANAKTGSVLFAVMQLTGSPSEVYHALQAVHGTTTVYSYGISDSPGGVRLYAPGSKQGVLVTGKPNSRNKVRRHSPKPPRTPTRGTKRCLWRH